MTLTNPPLVYGQHASDCINADRAIKIAFRGEGEEHVNILLTQAEAVSLLNALDSKILENENLQFPSRTRL